MSRAAGAADAVRHANPRPRHAHIRAAASALSQVPVLHAALTADAVAEAMETAVA